MAIQAAITSATDDQEVSTYLTEWLEHMAGRVRPKTFEGYRALIEHHAVQRSARCSSPS